MSNIVYIQKDNFFVRKYDDGFIVFFKKGSEGNLNYKKYSDEIHEFVVKNQNADIFTSDIIKEINSQYPDELKRVLYETLFVYKENGDAISAFRMVDQIGKKEVEVTYKGECVLRIENNKRFSYKWLVFISVILGIILGVIISNRMIDSGKNTDNEPSKQKESTTTDSIVNIPNKKQEKTTSFIKYDNDTNDEISEQIASEQEKIDDQYSHSSYKEEQNTDDISPENDSGKSRKISEAKEYLSKADAYYKKYFNTFDRNEGENALYNYKKVLEIIKDENIYSFERRESIESAVQVLEEELN